MPGRTVHHRMSGYLTFSFSHLFELARELSISLDQDGGHSRIDQRAVIVYFDHTVLERTSRHERPLLKDFRTQRSGEGHARFHRAFAQRELASPAPDAIGAPRPVQRGFNQRPA